MKKFFFHLQSNAGDTERDETGIACSNVDHAYLLACDSIPEVAAELLRQRKDPALYSFSIENESGEQLLLVPLTELVEGKTFVTTRASPAIENKLQRAQRRVRETTEHVRRQSDLLLRLERLGADTRLAQTTLSLFQQVLSQQRRHLALVTSEQPDRP